MRFSDLIFIERFSKEYGFKLEVTLQLLNQARVEQVFLTKKVDLTARELRFSGSLGEACCYAMGIIDACSTQIVEHGTVHTLGTIK